MDKYLIKLSKKNTSSSTQAKSKNEAERNKNEEKVNATEECKSVEQKPRDTKVNLNQENDNNVTVDEKLSVKKGFKIKTAAELNEIGSGIKVYLKNKEIIALSSDSEISLSEDEVELDESLIKKSTSAFKSNNASDYFCILCSKSIPFDLINSHAEEEHKNDIYCKNCKNKFSQSEEKIKHEKNCNNFRRLCKKLEFLECTHCNHLYRSDKLDQHVTTQHNNVPARLNLSNLKRKLNLSLSGNAVNGNKLFENAAVENNEIKEKVPCLKGLAQKLQSALADKLKK